MGQLPIYNGGGAAAGGGGGKLPSRGFDAPPRRGVEVGWSCGGRTARGTAVAVEQYFKVHPTTEVQWNLPLYGTYRE